MISKKQLIEKLHSLIKESDLLDQNVSVIQRFFEFCASNYNEFDAEAKKLCNHSIDGLLKDIKLKLKTVTNGVDKRKAIREIKKILNEHVDSYVLVEALERKSTNNSEFVTDARIFFINELQILLNVLCDATEHKTSGVANFAKLQLFYSCVYELVASFHLTQHGYINQSYTHLRTILETLDKIRLFQQQPNMAELWASDDPEDTKARRIELRPAEVRKKLGSKKKFDPLYNWFSEKGPHSTFDGLQAYSGMVKSTSEGKTEIIITLGGSNFKDEIINLLAFFLYVLIKVIHEAIDIYSEVLDTNEAIELLTTIGVDLKTYHERYYINDFIKNESDRKIFRKALNKLTNYVPTSNN